MGLFDFANSPEYQKFGSALQRLGQQDTAYRNDQHMEKVFAANPNYALKIYGQKNQQDDNEINRQLSLARLQSLAAGGDKPSALQELAALDQMTPEQKRNYWNIKRNQWQNAGGMLINPETGEQIQKTVSPDQQPALKFDQTAAINEADLIGKPKITQANAIATIVGESEGNKGKKEIQAPNIDNLIQEAKTILPASTSGLGGQAITGGAKAVGVSTDASKADARLKVLSAALTSTVPRFEGPQGVLDVELYKQAAGDVANTSLPFPDRLAALDTMEKLNKQYMPKEAALSTSGIPAGAVLIGSQGGKPVYKLPDGRGWTP